MAKYTIEVDRFGFKHHRPTSHRDFIAYELEHFSPHWTEEYKHYIARQAIKLGLTGK